MKDSEIKVGQHYISDETEFQIIALKDDHVCLAEVGENARDWGWVRLDFFKEKYIRIESEN